MHLICNSLKKLLKQPKALTCYILNLNISENFQKLTSQNSSENSIESKKNIYFTEIRNLIQDCK